MSPRYGLEYGNQQFAFFVKDRQMKTIVYKDNSKPKAIAVAQELNGFKPADGSEQTYGKQIAQYEHDHNKD